MILSAGFWILISDVCKSDISLHRFGSISHPSSGVVEPLVHATGSSFGVFLMAHGDSMYP